MIENSAFENIKKRIIDYVLDDRKQQAVLLDGDWGCGKTFFVSEELIPALKKIDDIQVYKISLYGVSNTDTIQDMIYANWIEKVLSDKTERLGTAGKIMAKSVGLFGKNALKAIEEKAGVGGAATDITDSILDNTMGKKKRMVLIFDDIERCRIEIVELMGFLNNLSENNGYRLILVANEREISNIPNNQELALKYIVALNQNIDIANNKKGKSGDNTEDVHLINKEDLVKRSEIIFGAESTYERTREKLIGNTIPYYVPLAESFDFIIDKYIKYNEIKKYVLDNKSSVVDIFNKQTHRNLRTLISACIAWEDIITEVNKIIVENESYKEEEKYKILKYIAVSAIRRSNGKKEFIWKANSRFGIINSSLFISEEDKVYGYAFVDEYWRNQCVDVVSIERDINSIIADKVEGDRLKRECKNHNNLAMFKLYDWYYMEESDVSALVDEMRTELKEKKYYPREFKDIIITLMKINNVNFGLGVNKESNDGAVFDSTESSQFVNYPEMNKIVIEHQFREWNQIDIAEFVDLMMDYFEDSECEISTSMIRVLSEDKYFAYEYRKLILPLLKKIEEIELDRIMKSDKETDIYQNEWDEEFITWCHEHKNEYVNIGRFLSLFNIESMKEKIVSAKAIEIHNLCEILKTIYSFSNLYDVFTADYETVCSFKMFIDENEKIINADRSRAKEIALVRLKSDLEQYKIQLIRENFVI